MVEFSDAILVTLSQATIKDRVGGYRQIIQEWLQSDGERVIWHYKCGNLPKRDVVWVYWVIGGKVRWRARVMETHKNKEMTFTDRDGSNPRRLTGNFLALIDFEQLPHPQVNRKGFQGFRYYQS